MAPVENAIPFTTELSLPCNCISCPSIIGSMPPFILLLLKIWYRCNNNYGTNKHIKFGVTASVYTSFVTWLHDSCVVFTCVSYAEARNRYSLDVRLSVCPSVTRWHPIKTAEHIVMLSSPHDSPFILVFLCRKIFAKFRRGHPLLGR